MKGPKVLILDLENWPLKVTSWGLYNQNHSHKQILQEKSILSFAAKEWRKPGMIYEDVRKQRNLHDDSRLAKSLSSLITTADILVGHNFKKFDRRVINTAVVTNGLQPINRYRILDTMVIAKRHFDFPSYSLEYLTARLCPHIKKEKSRLFIGQDLWDECDVRNPKAWDEMEKYNKQDVRATEALWEVLEPFDNSINFNLYTNTPESRDCKCGGWFKANGTSVNNGAIKQRFRCVKCGAEAKSGKNLIEKEGRKVILRAP